MSKYNSWFGHHFEARYSYGPAGQIKVEATLHGTLAEILEASKAKTYVHDVCVRCGKIIDARKSPVVASNNKARTYRAYCYLLDKLSTKVLSKNAFRITATTGLMLDIEYLMYAEENGAKLTKYEPHQFPELFRVLGVNYEEFVCN